jgi:hypothetical protein
MILVKNLHIILEELHKGLAAMVCAAINGEPRCEEFQGEDEPLVAVFMVPPEAIEPIRRVLNDLYGQGSTREEEIG